MDNKPKAGTVVHIATGAKIVQVSLQEYRRLKRKFVFSETKESFGIMARYISLKPVKVKKTRGAQSNEQNR